VMSSNALVPFGDSRKRRRRKSTDAT